MTPEPGGERRGEIEGLTKGRLEALTDGIFAFAMTLLVTTMDFPQPDVSAPLPALTLHGMIVTYLPDFMNYIIAFAVLAGFWVAHHTLFHHIRFIDMTVLWMNILSLLFVALLPFSTDLVGDYPDPLASIFFEANLLAIGLLLYIIWNYATTDRRLVDRDLDEAAVRIHGRRTLAVPVVSALAIFIAFLGFEGTTILYAATPLFAILIERRR
ncbi:MAG: TMEM175 family protein [Methanomicrobiales archaeon]|nr:TMEM175 family protein [Methanomicrobiales archaeon]MDD1670665.1 TMEM175 family protein [Methanomicrobiales archaeon]